MAMKPILKTGKSIIHCNKGNQPHEWKFEKGRTGVALCADGLWGKGTMQLQDNAHDQRKCNYWQECGQKIDWSDVK